MNEKKIIKNQWRRNAVRVILLAAAAAGVAGIFSALAVNVLLERIVHIRSEVIIPDIEGMELNQALDLLSESNLSLMKVAEKYDEEIPSGSIISQSPPPGLTVREGKAVEAVISSGGKVVFVPELIGKSLRQAELLLRQSGLGIGSQVRTFSSTVQRDHVVSQEPSPGNIAEQNSYINLVISRGPDDVEEILEMVNLAGLNIRSVDRVLAGLGLEVSSITTAEDDRYAEGTVIGQSPEEGKIIEAQTPVSIIITRRPRVSRSVRDAVIEHEVMPSVYDRDVRIILSDDIGERIVYQGQQPGGSSINIPLKVLGEAYYRVYYDGVPVETVILEYESEEPEAEYEDVTGPGEEPVFYGIDDEEAFPEVYDEE